MNKPPIRHTASVHPATVTAVSQGTLTPRRRQTYTRGPLPWTAVRHQGGPQGVVNCARAGGWRRYPHSDQVSHRGSRHQQVQALATMTPRRQQCRRGHMAAKPVVNPI